ncbi:unnamed protein product [Haemonchus placei]|uniref:CCHC-type domain-containing protein n=1 Tax=Haemonchus placei TaxID=6290 RepID=A0A0N4WUE1_HAEPC|nr:unnamed protein product [Haemonchus placei]
MDKPQRDDRGKPLVLDQHQLEHVISDQLDILEEYRSMLAELRHEIKGEEVHQEEKFQETVLSALTEVRESLKVGFQSILPGNGQNCLEDLKAIVQNETSKLQELIASGIDRVRNAVTDAIGKPSPPAASEDAIDGAGDDSGGEGEGTEVLQPGPDPPEEAEVIQQNAEFIENVAVDDGEEYEAVIWQRRRQIDREIFDAYAEIEELDNLIAELKREPKCEPRDFSRGVIRRWDERTICCVFCQGIGEHHSDSCEIYKESSVRRTILKGEHRCACCLEIRFQHHICRKYNAKCYHCKGYGHHSSVCDLPERSEEINRNLAQATHAKKGAERRIKELKEKLEELQSQVYPA